MASPKEMLKGAMGKSSGVMGSKPSVDYDASEARKEDRLMDEKMTPEQLVQDIKDDLDLLFRKLKAGK